MNPSRRALLKTGAMAGALAGLGSRARDARGGATERQESRVAEPDRAFNYPPEAYSGLWTNLRAVKEKKVIDFHTHCWETPYQGKTYADERAAHNKEDFKDYTEELIGSRIGLELLRLRCLPHSSRGRNTMRPALRRIRTVSSR